MEVSGVPSLMGCSSSHGDTKVDTKVEKKRKRGLTEKKRKDKPFVLCGRIQRPRILLEASRTLYATNLPKRGKCGRPRVKTADFENFFQQYGNIDVQIFSQSAISQFKSRDVEIFSDVAKIEFESHDFAKKALKDKHGTLFISSISTYVHLDSSLTPEPVKWNDDNLAERVVFVSGFGKTIPHYALRTNLKELFSSCGEIQLVSTPHNEKTSLSLGYAFIVFKALESTPKALEKDGTHFMSYTLEVRRAKVELDVKYV